MPGIWEAPQMARFAHRRPPQILDELRAVEHLAKANFRIELFKRLMWQGASKLSIPDDRSAHASYACWLRRDQEVSIGLPLAIPVAMAVRGIAPYGICDTLIPRCIRS